MESKVNYTIVGAFVIIMTAAIILCIIFLSSGLSFEQYTIFQVNELESVSGLAVGSQVEYNGVNVGTVKSIDLDKQNPHIVELLLNIKSSTPITRGTVATLTTRGLTGQAYVSLKEKSTDLRPLEALPGQPYPVIPTAPSIFLRLDTALTQISSSFQRISESMQSLLNKDNLESLKEILFSLKEVTNALAVNSDNLNKILINTKKASDEFQPLMKSTNGAMRILELQTLPAAYHLLSNLDDVSRTLQDVASQLKQDPSVIIRGSAKPPPGPGE